MRALKIPRREAVGIVCSITTWCLSNNRMGGIFEKLLIPEAVDWEKDPKPLVEALIDKEGVEQGISGWLDILDPKTVKVHDWEDITKGYRKAKEDAARRTEILRIARGELPPPEKPPQPDRSSSPEALAADAYMRINPHLHKRALVIAKIRVAKKAGAPMEKIMELCSSETDCKDVEIWTLLQPITPRFGKDTPAIESADKLLQEWSQRDKRLAKEHEAKNSGKGESVL